MDTHSLKATDNGLETKKLRRYFKFTNDALEENRLEILNEKQIKHVTYYEWRGK